MNDLDRAVRPRTDPSSSQDITASRQPPPPESAADPPLLLPPQPPLIGRTRLHASHTIMHDRGCFICTRCGYFVTINPIKLARPCTVQLTKYSRQCLTRFRSGRFPKSGNSWPESYSNLPAGTALQLVAKTNKLTQQLLPYARQWSSKHVDIVVVR